MVFYPNSDVLRAARALVGISQSVLAKHAGLGPNLVSKSETDGNSLGDTLHKIRLSLEALGVRFASDSEVASDKASHNDFLRAARAFTGMSQAELANLAGLDQKSISNAEKGENLTRQTEASLRLALTGLGIKFVISEGRVVSVAYNRPKNKRRNPSSAKTRPTKREHGH